VGWGRGGRESFEIGTVPWRAAPRRLRLRLRGASPHLASARKSPEWTMCGLRMGSRTAVPVPGRSTCVRREIAVGWGLSSREMSTPTRRHPGEERSCSRRRAPRDRRHPGEERSCSRRRAPCDRHPQRLASCPV
jgi:hypothetical protein